MRKYLLSLFLITSVIVVKGQTHDLTQGLIFYLPLDNNITDQSSLSHQVIVHYGPTHAPDRNSVVDNALEFNGASQALEVDYMSANASALAFGVDDFAIGFWVKKLSSTSGWDNTAAINIWNSGAYAGTNEWSFAIGGGGGSNSDQPQFTVAMADNTNYSVKSFNNDIQINQWTHLVAVREGADLRLYMDGVLQNTTNIGTGALNDTPRDMLIARTFSGSYFSHAVFDDIVIYDKALSASEISELMVYGVTTGGQGGGVPSASLWSSDSNDNIFYNSGNVGVGTTSPGELLELVNSSAPAIKVRHTNEQASWGLILGQKDDLNGYMTAPGRDLLLGAGWDKQIVMGVSEFDQYGGGVVMYGNVGIGTTSPGEKLEVNGTIRSKKVKVESTGWPDYVFAPSFKLRPLSEVASFIKENQHLPEVPSAKEIEKNGLDLGAMDATLLKKVEELTLYTLDQEKRIQRQNDLINKLLKRLEKLEKKD